MIKGKRKKRARIQKYSEIKCLKCGMNEHNTERCRKYVVVCFKCYKIRHICIDCEKDIRCRRCGGFGHEVKMCRTSERKIGIVIGIDNGNILTMNDGGRRTKEVWEKKRWKLIWCQMKRLK